MPREVLLYGEVDDSAITLFSTSPFITRRKTNGDGVSNATSIHIPTTGANYDFEIDWGDGTIESYSGVAPVLIHDYGTAGIYTVKIRGDFPRIFFNNEGDRFKLLSIDQRGDIQRKTMDKAFR